MTVSLFKKRTEVDMTQGNSLSLLLVFAFPLLLGNLFQQFYNMVDTWVVGNFVGKNSFSAVGTLGSIINTLIGFFLGFSNGASVVISRFFGAKNFEKVSDAVHSYVAITLILCVIFTCLGVVMVPLMLRLVKSPPEVAAEQAIYLRIYFAGVTGLLLYNMGSAILRAVGNSTLPFVFLAVCTVLNVILDLVFVIVLKLETAGVAYATILAQFVSAVLVVIMLLRSKSCIRVDIRKIRITKGMTKQIFGIGLPTALQQSLTAFSNVFVQSYINVFGADAMGGWTTYSKVDQFLFLPMQSLGLAVQTYVGQNLGAGLQKRAKKGANTGLFMAMIVTAVLIVPTMMFAVPIVKFFIDDGEAGVIEFGTLFLRYLIPCHIVACVNQVYGGALRGANKSGSAMIVMLCSFVFFRQIYLFVMSHYISNTILPIAMGYPAGWLVCSIAIGILFTKFFSDKNNLVSVN
ncbi:MAG: MATE family efflux transporter [Sphaerochaetaceae bacterium]|nr:MATE family efflux transporter [Sphaerochaetaceae bacterium]